MKTITKWFGLAVLAIGCSWAGTASAMVWWAPAPEVSEGGLAPVGENVAASDSAAIPEDRMAEITQEVLNAPPAPVGEGSGERLYLHVWPAGAVGPRHIIYIPTSRTRTSSVNQ